LRRYTDTHHLSLSQVIREGLAMRLHPQQAANGHTVIPQETAALLLRLAEVLSAAAEDIRSVCGLWGQVDTETGHTVILQEAVIEETREPPRAEAIQDGKSYTVLPEQVDAVIPISPEATEASGANPTGASAEQVLPYDASKYVLGKLCPRGHDY